MPKLTECQQLYVRSMGKWLRVTACFPTDEAANTFMARNRDHGVVACFGEVVLLANLYDRGGDGPYSVIEGECEVVP